MDWNPSEMEVLIELDDGDGVVVATYENTVVCRFIGIDSDLDHIHIRHDGEDFFVYDRHRAEHLANLGFPRHIRHDRPDWAVERYVESHPPLLPYDLYPSHLEHPHDPGRLYGCPGCEWTCHCEGGAAMDTACAWIGHRDEDGRRGPRNDPPF